MSSFPMPENSIKCFKQQQGCHLIVISSNTLGSNSLPSKVSLSFTPNNQSKVLVSGKVCKYALNSHDLLAYITHAT